MIADRFTGRRIRLTDLGDAYLDDLEALMGDVEAWRLVTEEVAVPVSREQAARFLEANRTDGRTCFHFAIVGASDGRFLGRLVLFDVRLHSRSCSLGIHVRRDVWGQGAGREAVALALAFAFSELGLHKVRAETLADNPRSIALLEGAGFHRDVRRRGEAFLGDLRRDVVEYSILEDEWRKQVTP